MNIAALAGGRAVRVLILTSIGGAPPALNDVHARIDEVVELHAAIEVSRPGRERCLLFTEATGVKTRCVVVAPPEGLRLTWSKLEANEKAYDNVPDGRFRVAEISWVESPWREGNWSVRADVTPVVREGLTHGVRGPVAQAGSMRYELRVTLEDGSIVSSQRPTDGVPGGPAGAKDARKVTFRFDDSYLGYLSELGGIPYIFGSTELGRERHQAERAIGVDCADLMIYGLKRMGKEVAYRSSRTLGPVSRSIVHGPTTLLDGRYLDGEGRPIEVGPHGVLPGDWIVFAGHVAAFFEDRGTPGVFDDADLIIHTAWREVAVEPFADSGYADAPFEVRRAHALAKNTP